MIEIWNISVWNFEFEGKNINLNKLEMSNTNTYKIGCCNIIHKVVEKFKNFYLFCGNLYFRKLK